MRLTLRRLIYLLGLSVLILAITGLAGRSTPGAMFARAVMETLAFLVLVWLPGQALLWHLKPAGLDDDDLWLLAVPATLLGYLALGIPLLWLGAPTFVFKLAFWPVVGVSLFVLWRRLRDGAVLVPRSALLSYLLACCAVCFVCVGMASPWKTMDWTLPARRGLHGMPVDNALQHWTAMVFVDNTAPWAVPGWTMGDRPPLYGLITSVLAKAFLLRKLKYFDYTILGIVFNSLYVIPLVRYLRRFKVSESFALLATVSIILAPAAFLNVYFTWPKLFGAFYTLVALAFFTRRGADNRWCWPSPRAAVMAGLILGFSAMAHGGSLLSVPVVLVLITLFPSRSAEEGDEPRNVSWRGTLRKSAAANLIAVGGALFVQLPWIIYKRLHPEINTNRLAYHYWPDRGVPGPVEAHELVPLREWLAASPVMEQLSERWSQVETTLTGGRFGDVASMLFTGDVVAFNDQRWPFEMFRPVSQVGELRIMLSVLACLALLGQGVLAKVRDRAASTPLDWRLSAVTAIVVCTSYLLNVFAKWRTIAPHELPLVELIVISAVLTLQILLFSRLLAALLLAFTLQRFLAYLMATTFARDLPLDLFASCLFATTFGMLWLAVHRGGSPSGDSARPQHLDREMRPPLASQGLDSPASVSRVK